MSQDSNDQDSYNIYRDGDFFDFTEQSLYNDETAEHNIEYCVCLIDFLILKCDL